MFQKKSDPWMLSTLLLAGIFVGVVLSKGYDLLSDKINSDTPPQNQQQQQQGQQQTAPVVIADVSADDDAMLGNPDAKVTIIEFSDFQCPYCAKFVNAAYQDIKTKYIDTGKVNLVFRDFPLSFHPQAMKAAMASECARDQEEEKFWEMHDMLFAKTTEWSGNEDAVSIFKGYASDLGLNTSEFNSCMDSDKFADEINKDLSDARSSGVSGTPTFFINGQKVVGALPFTSFEKIIEEELSK